MNNEDIMNTTTPTELRELAEAFAERKLDTCNDDDSNRLYEALRSAANMIESTAWQVPPLCGDTVESATIAMDAYMDRHPNAAHEDYVRVALEAVWP